MTLGLPNTDWIYVSDPNGHHYTIQARGRGVLDAIASAGAGPFILISWFVHWLAFPRQWVVEVKEYQGSRATVKPPTLYVSPTFRSRSAAVAEMRMVIQQIVSQGWLAEPTWTQAARRRLRVFGI